MLQIVFNEISAAEISTLGALEQMELLDGFRVGERELEAMAGGDGGDFGKLVRDGKTLYRYRSGEWRIYFEAGEKEVVVHRVLHRNSFDDFLYRTKLGSGGNEDEILAGSKNFWKLIDEGRRAKRA